MALRDDDEFTPFDRLIDGSGDDRSGEKPWVLARAVELIKSMDPFPKGGRIPVEEASEESKSEGIGGAGAREQ
jgi:hypothetical protein